MAKKFYVIEIVEGAYAGHFIAGKRGTSVVSSPTKDMALVRVFTTKRDADSSRKSIEAIAFMPGDLVVKQIGGGVKGEPDK